MNESKQKPTHWKSKRLNFQVELLLLLQNEPGLTAYKMEEKLRVPVSTIYRNLNTLLYSGIIEKSLAPKQKKQGGRQYTWSVKP